MMMMTSTQQSAACVEDVSAFCAKKRIKIAFFSSVFFSPQTHTSRVRKKDILHVLYILGNASSSEEERKRERRRKREREGRKGRVL